MIKCIYEHCQWPECDKTCGMVPTGDYVVGSSAEEKLIYYLQDELAKLRIRLYQMGNKINGIYDAQYRLRCRIDDVMEECQEDEYTPSCPHGFVDCVCDPAYIRYYYPDWWVELGMPIKCTDCEGGERYDDEDK